MLDEPEEDVLELGESPGQEEADPNVSGEHGEGQASEDDDVEIPTFDDPAEDEDDDHPTLKKVRAVLRETQRELAEAKKVKPSEPEIVVGEEPTLESCDFDDERFKVELRAYDQRKAKAEAQANTISEEQRRQNEIWQARASDFAQKRTVYPPAIMTECETALATTLNDQQRFAVIRYAKNPAALTIALGRSQAKLDALAKIEDIGEFIAETALLEREIKMSKRRPAAQPERIVKGSASMSANSDKHEEKLAAEARRTGDRSKLIAYRAERAK